MKNNVGDEKNNGKGKEEEVIMYNHEDEVIDDDYIEDAEEEVELNISKGSKNIIIAIIVTIVVSFPLGLLLYEYNNRESGNIKNVSVKGQKISTSDNSNEEVGVKKIDNIDKIYDEVHKMSNSLIIAEDSQIWGEEKITRKRINEVLEFVEGIDEFLAVEIKKWDKLDFNNAVEVHNYVWEKLGGNVGKAIDLNNEGISKTITEIDNQE